MTIDSLSCSFCGKRQENIRRLIRAPENVSSAHICDECVAVCASILQDDEASKPEVKKPDRLPLYMLDIVRNRKK